MTHIRHRGRHLDEFLEFFFISVCVNAVRTVAFFLIWRIDIHWLILVTNFLYCELYSANLQNVPLLNFIVLIFVKKWLIIELKSDSNWRGMLVLTIFSLLIFKLRTTR